MSKKEEPMVDAKILDEMNSFQLSRWLALFEGINVIADNAEKCGKKFEYINLKPIALEEYVDRASDLIYRELTKKEK